MPSAPEGPEDPEGPDDPDGSEGGSEPGLPDDPEGLLGGEGMPVGPDGAPPLGMGMPGAPAPPEMGCGKAQPATNADASTAAASNMNVLVADFMVTTPPHPAAGTKCNPRPPPGCPC